MLLSQAKRIDQLENHTPTIISLKESLACSDISICYAGLVGLGKILQSTHGNSQRRQLLELIPRSLNALSLECQIEVARLFRHLPHTETLPKLVIEQLPRAAQLEWLVTSLARDSLAPVPDHSLRNVVEKLDWNNVAEPEQLIAQLLKNADPATQASLIDQLHHGVIACTIPVDFAFEQLISLLDREPPVVTKALHEMTQPWFRRQMCPSETLVRLAISSKSDAVSMAAVDALGTWNRHDDLIELISNHSRNDLDPKPLSQLRTLPKSQSKIRQRVAMALSDCALPEDFKLLFDTIISGDNQESHLEPLVQLRRRGCTLSNSEVDQLFRCSLSSRSWESNCFAELIGDRWGYWIQLLESLQPDDPSWALQINIAFNMPVYCSRSGNKTSSMRAIYSKTFDLLFPLLSENEFKAHTPLLIDGLGRYPLLPQHRNKLEACLIALADQFPSDVSKALQRIGDSATEEFMLARVVSSEELPLSTEQARQWLASAGDVDDLTYFLGDPSEWTANFLQNESAFRALSDPAVTNGLCQVLSIASHPARLAAIDRLGQIGDADALPALTQLLREEDEEFLTVVRDAIRQIGSRLFRSNWVRPACLIDAANENEAGDFVLADCLLGQIEQTNNTEDLRHGLTQLANLPHPQMTIHLEHLRNHSSTHIVKLVIECLAKSVTAGEAHLLREFAVSNDHFTARQAINSLGAIGAKWASPDLVAALDHPNMNIKKSAAVALQTAGDINAAEAIVNWISKHDNPGFRDELGKALKSILGQGSACTLLAALQKADHQSEIDLLLDSLNRQIPMQAIVLLSIRDREAAKTRWFRTLIQRIVDETIELKDGSPAALKSALAARGASLKAFSQTKTIAPPTSLVSDDVSTDELLNLDSELPSDRFKLLRERLPLVLEVLNGESFDDADRALSLLTQFADRFTKSEQVGIADSLRVALRSEHLPILQLLNLLSRCNGVMTHDVAQTALHIATAGRTQEIPTTTMDWIFSSCLQFPELVGQVEFEPLNSIIKKSSSETKRQAIRFALDQNWHERLLTACCKWPGPAIKILREQWQLSVFDTPELHQLTTAFEAAPRDSDGKSELLNWILQSQSPNVEAWILSGLGVTSRFRARLNGYLINRRSDKLAARLIDSLDHTQRDHRQNAARILLTWKQRYHRPVIEAYLDGRLGGQFQIRIDLTEVDQWPDLFEVEVFDWKRLQLISTANGTDDAKIQQLLEFHSRLESDLDQEFNCVMRRLPIDKVCAAIGSELEAGRLSYIDFLGNTDFVSPSILHHIKQCEPNGLVHWLTLLKNWAALCPLRGAGLHTHLLLIAADSKLPERPRRLAIWIYGRLADWSVSKFQNERLASLGKFLKSQSDGLVADAAAESILHAADGLAGTDQTAFLLQAMSIEARPEFIERLSELYLARPSVLDEISDFDLQSHVQQFLFRMAKNRDPQLARSALNRLVSDGEEPMTELLIESLEHTQSTVRALAHRLLRRESSKEVYWDATMMLLDDRMPEFRKTAIRVLSFARYEPAMRKIVPLLFDNKKHVDRAARDGLSRFGADALPELRRLLNRERPDRRPKIQEVIELIEAID